MEENDKIERTTILNSILYVLVVFDLVTVKNVVISCIYVCKYRVSDNSIMYQFTLFMFYFTFDEIIHK